MDITHDNVCSSMLSCFYSHLLSTGRPISSSLCIELSLYDTAHLNKSSHALTRDFNVFLRPVLAPCCTHTEEACTRHAVRQKHDLTKSPLSFQCYEIFKANKILLPF